MRDEKVGKTMEELSDDRFRMMCRNPKGKSKKANQKIMEVEKLDKKVVTLYGKRIHADAWESVCQVMICKDILELDLALLPVHVRHISVNVS